MQEYPPPYEMATARDAWAIVAPYIPSTDLCAASLVCQKWHQMFVPFLWGSPASHFGTDKDAMYVAVTRFRKTLTRSRLWIRCLTHTLHLPPALTDIYGGPRSTWLLDVLEYLPNLQSLLVSQLPFFDHSALTALKPGSTREGRSYGLRLLLAQREPNTTSVGIAEAMQHFPRLVYLDLSYTTPARDTSVLSTFSQLSDLQVLKLRGIGLRDPGAEILANAIGTRVRLLDLRNNSLTDTALRSLLQACFLPPQAVANGSNFGYRSTQYEWSLHVTPSANILNSDSLKSEHLDEHLLMQLTTPLTGRTTPEDLPHVGVTHLYVTDNDISVEGLGSLLKTSRLHVLDGGTVDTAESIRKRQNTSVGEENRFITTVRFPGAEKLIPALAGAAANNLTYLRVHHAVVTEDTPAGENQFLKTFIPESASAGFEPPETELDAVSNEKPELPAAVEPVFEVADTSVSGSELEKASLSLSGDNERSNTGGLHGHRSPERDGRTDSRTVSSQIPPSPSDERSEKIQQLLAKRPKNSMPPRRNAGDTVFPYLHPSHLPHLRTLILTDVPSSVPSSSHLLKSLKRFITACSDEALLASLQARSNYSLPPGWARANAELQHAKSLFSLEKIILEITPVSKGKVQKGPSSWVPQGYYNPGAAKSSTEDFDSENLWEAAVNDFTFFGEEDEERGGIPDNERGKYLPRSSLNEKVSLAPPEDVPMSSLSLSELESSGQKPASHVPGGPNSMQGDVARGSTHQPPTSSPSAPQHQRSEAAAPSDPDVDVVQALAGFRKAKRAEYEELVRADQTRRFSEGGISSLPSHRKETPLHVEGHWKGEMKVVRNPAPKGRSGGVVDIYGNYFEKGYLYP